MKNILVIILSLINLFIFSQDKEVYVLLEKGNSSSIDHKIELLNKVEANHNSEFYIGVLTAKKADIIKLPKDKLQVFKEGVNIMENIIQKEPTNIEYRFLRYIIQCKSPKILKYKVNIEEDKKLIEQNQQDISNTLKQMIANFNKSNPKLVISI